MSEHTEAVGLVERLNLPWPPDGSGDEVTLPVWVFELMAEAATALTAERAAHAETQMVLDQEQERVIFIDAAREAAEARLAEALKALEPFAAAADETDEYDADSYHIWEHHTAMGISIGHLRAARRVREGGKADG